MTTSPTPASTGAAATTPYPFFVRASACADPDTRDYLATVWHEAGHGLVYRLHGIEVHSLQAIDPVQYREGLRPQDHQGQVLTDAIGVCDVGLQPWEEVRDHGVDPDSLSSSRILGFMSANVAGPVAEHLWHHDGQIRLRAFWRTNPLRAPVSDDCSGDDLQDVCANAALLAEERAAQDRNCRRHVHAMVGLFQTPEGWASLERVARALHRHGQLDAEALDQTIGLDTRARQVLIHPFSFRMGFATRMVDDLTG
ncbi:MAG: hypothetical protein RLZZ09_3674 [Pseudomonadota bacterium]